MSTLLDVLLGVILGSGVALAIVDVPKLLRKHRENCERGRRVRAIEEALSKPVEEDES